MPLLPDRKVRYFGLVLPVLFIWIVSCSNPLDSVSDDQYSLLLSGTGYIEIPYNASLDSLNTDTFTIELFFRADSITGKDSPALFMVSNDSGGNEIGIYRNLVEDDRVVVYMDDQPVPGINNIPVSGFRFQNGSWYFVAVSYDSGFVALYINGQQKLTGSLTDSAATIDIGQSPVLIGADLDDQRYGNFWNGAFDEVRVWKTTLTPEQIAYHARYPSMLSEHYERGETPRELLLGLWRFNTGKGNRIIDDSDYKNHGFLQNNTGGRWLRGGIPY